MSKSAMPVAVAKPATESGLSIFQLIELIPDEVAAMIWLMDIFWPFGIHCPHCGSTNVQSGVKHKSMTHRCRDCKRKNKKSMFSLKVGTVMENSKLSCRTWVFAIYFMLMNPKGISSVLLGKYLGITQCSAWHLGHRIRDAFFEGKIPLPEAVAAGVPLEWEENPPPEASDAQEPSDPENNPPTKSPNVKESSASEENPDSEGADSSQTVAFAEIPFSGTNEMDETFVGGKEGNKHFNKKLRAGRGAVGKTIVVGVLNRETNSVYTEVVEKNDRKTLHGIAVKVTEPSAKIYTDDAAAYRGMPREHDFVCHSLGKYVEGDVHTNGIESFWALIKRTCMGTHHYISKMHMIRYLRQISGIWNIRNLSMLERMRQVAAGMKGRKLQYSDLVA